MRALFCTLFAAALLVAGCTKTKLSDAASSLPGRRVFESNNCTRCHGSDGEGGMAAPSLRDVSARLSKAQLAEYLRDPDAFARKDERIGGMAGTYPTRMPGFPNIAPADLDLLVDYLHALN